MKEKNPTLLHHSQKLFTQLSRSFTTVEKSFSYCCREFFATVVCILMDEKIPSVEIEKYIHDKYTIIFSVFERFYIDYRYTGYKKLFYLRDFAKQYITYNCTENFIDGNDIPSISEFTRKLCLMDFIYLDSNSKHRISKRNISQYLLWKCNSFLDLNIITCCANIFH